jgi:multiple sugar transport system permease protein
VSETERVRSGRRDWGAYVFLAPYLVLFFMFLVLPLGCGLVLSLMRYELVSPLPNKFIGLGNYAEAVGDERFWRSLWATARFVLMAVPCTVVLALVLAVLLDRISARRAWAYRLAIFLPTMITVSVVGLVWRWFYNSEFGVFNAILSHVGIKVPWITSTRMAMPSLVLMSVWWTVGTPTLILLAGLKQISPSYHEPAAIDGATAWQRFRHITLPLLRPVMLFVVVTYTIGAFQVFGQPFIVTGGGPVMSTHVLVQYVYEMAFQAYRLGYGAAMSWMLFVLIAGISVVVFRVMKEE